MNYKHVLIFFIHLLAPASGRVCEDVLGQAFRPDPTDCSRYFFCTPQKAWPLQCPSGTVWNQVSSKCEDKSTNNECTKHVLQKHSSSFMTAANIHLNDTKLGYHSSEIATVMDRWSSKYFCPHKAYKRVAHPTRCAQFYDCSETTDLEWWGSNLRECPPGTVYDDKTKQCSPAGSTDCKGRELPKDTCDYLKNQCRTSHCIPCHIRHATCKGLADGIHHWRGRELSPYFIDCKNEKLNFHGRCQTAQSHEDVMYDNVAKSCVQKTPVELKKVIIRMYEEQTNADKEQSTTESIITTTTDRNLALIPQNQSNYGHFSKDTLMLPDKRTNLHSSFEPHQHHRRPFVKLETQKDPAPLAASSNVNIQVPSSARPVTIDRFEDHKRKQALYGQLLMVDTEPRPIELSQKNLPHFQRGINIVNENQANIQNIQQTDRQQVFNLQAAVANDNAREGPNGLGTKRIVILPNINVLPKTAIEDRMLNLSPLRINSNNIQDHSFLDDGLKIKFGGNGEFQRLNTEVTNKSIMSTNGGQITVPNTKQPAVPSNIKVAPVMKASSSRMSNGAKIMVSNDKTHMNRIDSNFIPQLFLPVKKTMHISKLPLSGKIKILPDYPHRPALQGVSQNQQTTQRPNLTTKQQNHDTNFQTNNHDFFNFIQMFGATKSPTPVQTNFQNTESPKQQNGDVNQHQRFVTMPNIILPETTTSSIVLPETMPNIAFPKTMPNVAFPKTMPNVALPETMPNITYPKTMPNVALPETMPNIALPRNMLNVALPETMPNIALPETMSNTALPETMPNIAVTETMPNIALPESMPNIALAETTPTAVLPKTMPNIILPETTPSPTQVLKENIEKIQLLIRMINRQEHFGNVPPSPGTGHLLQERQHLKPPLMDGKALNNNQQGLNSYAGGTNRQLNTKGFLQNKNDFKNHMLTNNDTPILNSVGINKNSVDGITSNSLRSNQYLQDKLEFPIKTATTNSTSDLKVPPKNAGFTDHGNRNSSFQTFENNKIQQNRHHPPPPIFANQKPPPPISANHKPPPPISANHKPPPPISANQNQELSIVMAPIDVPNISQVNPSTENQNLATEQVYQTVATESTILSTEMVPGTTQTSAQDAAIVIPSTETQNTGNDLNQNYADLLHRLEYLKASKARRLKRQAAIYMSL